MKGHFQSPPFSYLRILSLIASSVSNWFRTSAQLFSGRPFHFLYSSPIRKYNSFSNAFSFGKAPFFVTLRKLESALSKLSQMTDEEFDALELYPDFDAWGLFKIFAVNCKNLKWNILCMGISIPEQGAFALYFEIEKWTKNILSQKLYNIWDKINWTGINRQYVTRPLPWLFVSKTI